MFAVYQEDVMQQLKLTGLRYGDSCAVITPSRPSRRIPLNRTKWDIVPEGDQERENVPLICVPGAQARSFRWRLELVPVQEESRFLLRSIDGTPFTVNGQWGREAFLEGHDTLGLDSPGRLEFRREGLAYAHLPPAMPEALQDPRVLTSSLPVLLQGETGTGKSHLAREIHAQSGRRGAFVTLNVASLAAGLVETELFGHKRGAFTGAHADRPGALAQASDGTLFLDEIDSLTPELQVKLLLFLDRGFYRPVGAVREERTNARMIFASGRSLRRLVSAGGMRADFYFRLGQGVVADLRPLRECPEEITRHCQLFGIENQVVVGSRLTDFYRTLPWPGNVRQLYGHLLAKKVRSKTRKLDFDGWDERLLTMSSDLSGIASTDEPLRPMEDVKRHYARQAFQRCRGEVTRTARELGVNPKTLKAWLREA